MNNEFRARDKEDNEWTDGQLITRYEGSNDKFGATKRDQDGEIIFERKYYIYHEDFDDLFNFEGGMVEVFEDTIQKYTGKMNKFGFKLYSGEKVSCYGNTYTIMFGVNPDTGVTGFYLEHEDGHSCVFIRPDNFMHLEGE